MNPDKITKEADLQAYIDGGWRLVKNVAINPRLSRDSYHVEKDGRQVTVHAACANRAIANDMVRVDWYEHTQNTGILTHIHYRGPNQDSNKPEPSAAEKIKACRHNLEIAFTQLKNAKSREDALKFGNEMLRLQLIIIKLGG